MLRISKTQILRNVASSWFALGTNVLVGIFLSPFIIHRLGDAAYGIWILIFSVTGYYGLFDLGIRSSVIRFVAKFSTTGDRDNLAEVMNTSLFVYVAIGAAVMMLTIAGSFFVEYLFRIPPELRSISRELFLVVGLSVALGFPLGVFGGALEGLQRYYLVNCINVLTTSIRAGAIVFALSRGHGLMILGLITTILPLLSSLVRASIALSILQIPIGIRYVTRRAAGLIARHGGFTFIALMSAQLRFQSDELVIGSMLSTSAITYFSIGARIVDYASSVVTCFAQFFVPMSSQSEAKGDANGLRRILIAGNRACAFVIFPLSACLIILGKSIIEVWVGARYVQPSYPVMIVLIIPFTLMLAQGASNRTLIGTSQHGTFAMVTLAEGIANVVLSILLIRPYGIFGDALGTAIPMTCTALFFLPRHICRNFGMSLWTFVREAYSLPLLLGLPFVTTLLLEQRWFVPHRKGALCLQFIIAWGIYGAGFLWIYLKKRAFRVHPTALKEELRSLKLGPDNLLRQRSS